MTKRPLNHAKQPKAVAVKEQKLAQKPVQELKIPEWPFSRRSETLQQADWPKLYKKIRDKAIKQLEKELDDAHLTIKDLLDQRDALQNGGASALQKINQATEIIKQLTSVLAS